MAKEWQQKCKDCGKTFGYSDYALQVDMSRGFSRPERCPDCRNQHGVEIKSIANSHFALKPRNGKRSILGIPYLGEIGHGQRIPNEMEVEPDGSGMDLGMTDDHIIRIYDTLLKENVQVLVIVAPTGTGKSTYIPFRLIDPINDLKKDTFTRNGPIVVTQPRRLAASGIAKAIAEKLYGSSYGPGFEIGYRHGDWTGEGKGEVYDRRNRLLFVTDGSLLNWIGEGKIEDYSIIMIDEAHERSKNIDLILGLVKSELLKYSHLRLIIASATIDSERFVNYFAEIVPTKLLDFSDCQKTYGYIEQEWNSSKLTPDEISFIQTEEIKNDSNLFLKKYEKDISRKLAKKVLDILNKTKKGGILGFLHGKNEIEECVNYLREETDGRNDLKILPLYAELSTYEQDLAKEKFQESDRVIVKGKSIFPRRIVIATNIAETSLTVPDIVYVVDSGLIKQSDWNPTTCRQELRTQFHSKDGCKQRWGRAGRVQKGFVYKLYTKEQFIKYFPHHTSPEIERECLDDTILKAKASGIEDIRPEKFSWLQEPNPEELERAFTVFNERKLVDNDNDLTEEGREVYRLANRVSRFLDKYDPLSTNRALDVATLLIKADKYACLVEAVTAIVMMPHMGNSLYVDEEQNMDILSNFEGLLLWNKKWDLNSKDYIWRLHRELHTGCIDDLDLSCKLFALYEQKVIGLSKDLLKDWTKRYFINTKNFERLAIAREEILDLFTKGKKSTPLRPIDFWLVEKVRFLMAISWPDRIVDISKHGNQLIFENTKLSVRGILSSNSTGQWSKGNKAVIGLLDQSDLVIDSNRKGAPVINFAIKAPGKVLEPDASDLTIISELMKVRNEYDLQQKTDDLFGHLFAPVGSRITLSGKKKVFAIDEVELPSLFAPKLDQSVDLDIKYEEFDSRELYEHKLVDVSMLRKISRKYHEVKTKIKLSGTFKYELADEKKLQEGFVIDWKMKNDSSVATLGSKNEKQLINAEHSYLREEPELHLHLLRPVFNPQPNKIVGFIAKHESGKLIPLTYLNLSIEQSNPALLKYKNHTFRFSYFKTKSIPQILGITILPAMEKDLSELIKKGIVEAEIIKITTEKVYFLLKGTNKLIHSTDLNIDHYLRFGLVDHLQLGEKLRLEINSRFLKDPILSITIDDEKKLDYKVSRILKSKNIEVEDNILKIQKRLTFQELIDLQEKLPHLAGELRGIYSISNHITIIKIEVISIYLNLKKKGEKIKEKAITKGIAIQNDLKEYRTEIYDHKKFLLNQSVEELIELQNIAWQITTLQDKRKKIKDLKMHIDRWDRNISKSYTYLTKVNEDIKNARTEEFKRGRIAKKNEVESQIQELESKKSNVRREIKKIESEIAKIKSYH